MILGLETRKGAAKNRREDKKFSTENPLFASIDAYRWNSYICGNRNTFKFWIRKFE